MPTTQTDTINIGLLHVIFFHRLFTATRPLTRDINSSSYSISLPAVDDVDVETDLSDRVTLLVDRLRSSPSNSPKGTLSIRFYEKRRRKITTISERDREREREREREHGLAFRLFGRGYGESNETEREVKGEEKVCWERWTVHVMLLPLPRLRQNVTRDESVKDEEERSKVVKREFDSLEQATLDVVNQAGDFKEHIPLITTHTENPFPYEIDVQVGAETRR